MCNDPMSYADRQDALTVARTKVIREARKISEWHKGAFEGDEKCPCHVCKSVRELERLEGGEMRPERSGTIKDDIVREVECIYALVRLCDEYNRMDWIAEEVEDKVFPLVEKMQKQEPNND